MQVALPEMSTWQGPKEPDWPTLSAFKWVMFGLRAFAWIACTLMLLPIYGALRLVEAVVGGHALTQPVVWLWAQMGMTLAGLRLVTVGTPMQSAGAVVANHASWLDIFVIRAAISIYFVAKSDVRSWAGIGQLAAMTRTLFIERRRSDAKKQEKQFRERLDQGHRLCFFPEGTSSDGVRVLPFKSTLFSVFMDEDVKENLFIQPITVLYKPQRSLPFNFYGWWGAMSFSGHMIQVFGRSYCGEAKVVFHAPVKAGNFPDRKTLSAFCDEQVRVAMEAEMEVRGITPPPPRELSD